MLDRRVICNDWRSCLLDRRVIGSDERKLRVYLLDRRGICKDWRRRKPAEVKTQDGFDVKPLNYI